jgi:drug/metabolite transporter (DMT)-like permease
MARHLAILPRIRRSGVSPTPRRSIPREAAIDMLSDTAAREAAARRSRLIGIALICGAVGTFACLDTTAKYLGREIAVMQVVWARYTFALLLTLPISNPLRRPGLLRTGRPILQIGRATLLLGSTMLNFFALRYLRLDQALAIAFSTPFLVAALSGPVLGEWVGPRRWAAIAVGMLGVLVVTRPGFAEFHPAALLAMLSAFCYAFYFLSTRAVAHRFQRNHAVLFEWRRRRADAPRDSVRVDGVDARRVRAAGTRRSACELRALSSHCGAPPCAAVAAFAVFGDVPDGWTLFGAAIVIGSGLYILHRERMSGPRRRKATETAIETGD